MICKFFLAQAPKHVLSFATNENNNESPDFGYAKDNSILDKSYLIPFI